jgi:tetratricopeptide (TPR) repeat protein
VKDNNIPALKSSRQLAYLLIFIFSGLFPVKLHSQTVVRPTRQSSIEAFSNGNYGEALNQFTELLKLYPRDPLYKYYSGVCLVELRREPAKAASLLEDALKGSAALRSLPEDALFYHGRALQMAGRFGEAIDNYRKFEDQAGRKISKEKGVPELIQQCLDHQGQLAESETASPTPNTPAEKVKPASQPVQVAPPVATPAPVPVKRNLPITYEALIQQALKLQFSADSVTGILQQRKKDLAAVAAENREAEKKYIALLELTASTYQKQADQKFSEAAALKPGAATAPAAVQENKPLPASQDTVKPALPSKPMPSVQKEAPGIYSVFEIKPAVANEPVEIDPQVPDGLVYRIQMAVFRNPVKMLVFKGITPIYGFRLSANGLTNYYAGMFRRSDDASKALVKVKAKGFNQSFIVPFMGKKPVSAEKAAVLEKDWSKVPLFRVEQKKEQVQSPDTLPPTLVFRIEVTRSKKPLDAKKTEELRKVAGSRGLDIITAEDGNRVYLIGKFITFESAAEYNDILVRNGYRDSKVVAWLGSREIPVETAKRLFEKIE